VTAQKKVPKAVTDEEWQEVGEKKEKKDKIYNQAPTNNARQTN